jgi:hypothetical protein
MTCTNDYAFGRLIGPARLLDMLATFASTSNCRSPAPGRGALNRSWFMPQDFVS